MWCIAFVRQVKTVSQTLQCTQNCLDKSIHMQLIIHTFYSVFRTDSCNQKVKRFDHSIEEMHQNFLFLVSDWMTGLSLQHSDTSNHCMLLNQISTLRMTSTIIFSYLKNKDLSNPTYLWAINSKMLSFAFIWLCVEKCDTCLDKKNISHLF